MTTPSKNYALIAQRRAAGLSQKALAREAGCAELTIYRYERGDIPNPRYLQAESIARVLGVGVEEIFSETSGPRPVAR